MNHERRGQRDANARKKLLLTEQKNKLGATREKEERKGFPKLQGTDRANNPTAFWTGNGHKIPAEHPARGAELQAQ